MSAARRVSSSSGNRCVSDLTNASGAESRRHSTRPTISSLVGSMMPITSVAYDLEPIVYTWTVAS